MPKGKKFLKFPTLSEKELSGDIKSLGIRHKKPFNSNTPRDLLKLYKDFISRLFVGASNEDIYGAKGNVDTFHENSTEFVSFVFVISKVYKYANLDDFDANTDLLYPTQRRIEEILSGIMNLIKFISMIKDEVQNCKKINFFDSNNLEEIKKKKEYLKGEIKKLEEKMIKESSEKTEITKLISQTHKEISHQQNRMSNISKMEKNMKEKQKEKKKKLEKGKKDLAENQEKFTFLKNQIVNSPEKIKSMLDNLKQKIDDEKQFCERIDKKIRVYKNYENVVVKLKKKIKSRSQDCKDILDIMDEIKTKKKNVKIVSAQIEEMTQKTKALEENKEVLVNSQGIEERRNDELEKEIEDQQGNMESAWEKMHNSERTVVKSQEEHVGRKKDIRSKIEAAVTKEKSDEESERALIESANEELLLFDNWSEDYCKRLEGLFEEIRLRESRWAGEIFERENNGKRTSSEKGK